MFSKAIYVMYIIKILRIIFNFLIYLFFQFKRPLSSTSSFKISMPKKVCSKVDINKPIYADTFEKANSN